MDKSMSTTTTALVETNKQQHHTVVAVDVKSGLPKLEVIRPTKFVTGAFGTDITTGPFPIRLGKTMLTLLSFEWTSWGNGSASDLKDQTLQEVQNFAILSALAMSLGLAAVLVVDGADNWSGAYREGMGIVFNISNTSFVISLLTAAFILLLINEAPNGRATVALIDDMGSAMKVPGLAFVIGVYMYAAILFVWQLHSFNLWITIGMLILMTFAASGAIFGALYSGCQSLFVTMRKYGTICIDNDAQVLSLVSAFVTQELAGKLAQYKKDAFKDWVLEAYDAHEFADLSARRMDRVLEEWEKQQTRPDGEEDEVSAISSNNSSKQKAPLTAGAN